MKVVKLIGSLLLLCASLVSAQVVNPTNVLGTNSTAIKFIVLGSGFEQLGTAGWINEVCGLYGPCDFIATPGHCFYPSGAHATDNPSRFITDWRNVYHLEDKANIIDLPWYITLGDHDQNGDVAGYINFNNIDQRWVFPSRYYLQDISNPYNNVSVRLIVLDDQPWLSANVAQPGKNYSATSNQANPEFQFQALTNASSPFNREIALLTQYNISAVFTADDYVLHYGRVDNITLTPQFNVGSASEADCGDGQYYSTPPYQVPWVDFINSNCSTDQSNNGFVMVTATKQNMKVDLYTTTLQPVSNNYYTVPNYSPNYTVIIPPGKLKGANGGLTFGPTNEFYQTTAPAPAPATAKAPAASTASTPGTSTAGG